MLDAAASVARQSFAARETIIVCDHNRRWRPILRGALPGLPRHREPGVATGLSGARNTGASSRRWATSWRSSTTTRSRATTGWRSSSLRSPTAGSTVVGGAVDPIWAAERPGVVPRRVRLGGRLQPPRRPHADGRPCATHSAGTWRSASRRCRPSAGSGRASGGSGRAPWAARRRTSASASCARAPRRSWCSSPARGSRTTSRRRGPPCATSSPAATTRASRRRSWRRTAAPTGRSRRSGGTCVTSCPTPCPGRRAGGPSGRRGVRASARRGPWWRASACFGVGYLRQSVAGELGR